MFERTRPIADPVRITFDGREITAERGEPLAVTLLAAGEGTLARSPKLHRPRGPACLRGDCDGCTARVDGVPNVITCLRETRGGEQVEAQNVLGSRKTDLLRITDWFFPQGIDHHHLMAGVPGIGTAMQTFARQLAGVGRLPDGPHEIVGAAESRCDALVIGGGLAGLACAAAIGRLGASVLVVDEGLALGGSAAFAPDARARARQLATEVQRACEVISGATVAGLYEGRALVAEPVRARIVTPRATVIAAGAHDGMIPVSGNDLPGVMSARSVCMLAERGILPKQGAVVVGEDGWAERAASVLGDRLRGRVAAAELDEVRGRSKVDGVKTKANERIACGVVAVATRPAPAFELAVQAGARTRAGEAGFAVVTEEAGRSGEALWATGECTGADFDPDRLVGEAERAARDLVRALSLR